MFNSETGIVLTFLAVLALIIYFGYRYNQKNRKKQRTDADNTGFMPMDSNDLPHTTQHFSHQHSGHDAEPGHHSADHFHDSAGIDSSGTGHGGFDSSDSDGGGDN